MQFFRFNQRVKNNSSSYLISSVRNCSAASASATTETQTSSSSSSAEHNARFLTFDKKTFLISQVDYCFKLAEEANQKHGVPVNIPPQACPDTFDHRVVYCEILGKRTLDPSLFAYPIQFEPPPKHIPGMETPKTERQLMQEAAAAAATPSIVGKKKPATTPAATAAVVDATAPVKKSNLLTEFPNPFKIQKYSEMHNIASSGMDGFSMNAWKEYSDKMKNNARQVEYPTDDEIDTLLLQVWDPIVNKRVPEFTKMNPKFTFRECKEYIVADANSDELKRSKLKISEAVLRGESAKAKVPGVSPEHQVHFVTPFTNISIDESASGGNATDALGPPKLSKYADKNAFACVECSFTFRTYDGLKQHYAQDHRGKSIPVVKDLEFRDVSFRQQNGALNSGAAMGASSLSSSNSSSIGAGGAAASQLKMKLELLKQKKQKELLEKQQQRQQKEKAEEEKVKITEEEQQQKQQEEENAVSANTDVDTAEQQKKSTAANTTLTGEDAIQATPLPEVDISLHSRSTANIQIMGLVRQIQRGYAGKDFVAELLVETEYDAENEEDKDVFTVRCFGQDFANLTADSLEEGKSRVLIRGTYKSNLHIDRASGKPQCFPFVKVMPPFGNVISVA